MVVTSAQQWHLMLAAMGCWDYMIFIARMESRISRHLYQQHCGLSFAVSHLVAWPEALLMGGQH